MAVSRRTFLKATLALPLATLLPAHATRERLLPVDVSAERVTRRLVGLRPYRPSGFVVKTQRLDEKTVVHNYGHGGGGITLSWGTSSLAVDLAWATGYRDFAVLGCGAVGLATARLLQQRGGRVSIYARDLPPQTTSNIAGGQFMPASVSEPERRTPAWNEQFRQALAFSFRAYQDLVGDDYGVTWLDNYFIEEQPDIKEPFPLARDRRDFSRGESPFPGLYARRFTTLMVLPPVYLRRMLDDVLRFGGQLHVVDLPDLGALARLPEPVLLNCTGLGSRTLFGDEELIPVKGQLSVLLPQAEIDYAYLFGGLYMFPRQDGIILGGTYRKRDSSLEFDPRAEEGILAGHLAVARRLG